MSFFTVINIVNINRLRRLGWLRVVAWCLLPVVDEASRLGLIPDSWHSGCIEQQVIWTRCDINRWGGEYYSKERFINAKNSGWQILSKPALIHSQFELEDKTQLSPGLGIERVRLEMRCCFRVCDVHTARGVSLANCVDPNLTSSSSCYHCRRRQHPPMATFTVHTHTCTHTYACEKKFTQLKYQRETRRISAWWELVWFGLFIRAMAGARPRFLEYHPFVYPSRWRDVLLFWLRENATTERGEREGEWEGEPTLIHVKFVDTRAHSTSVLHTVSLTGKLHEV